MAEVLKQIRAWYKYEIPHQDADTTSEWMGPVTMLRALRTVVQRDCPGHNLHRHDSLQWPCGKVHAMRLYQELPLICTNDWGDPLTNSTECPPVRAQAEFPGVKFGIFSSVMQERWLVAWPRFENCRDWGCKAGGWDETPAADPTPSAGLVGDAGRSSESGEAAENAFVWLYLPAEHVQKTGWMAWDVSDRALASHAAGVAYRRSKDMGDRYKNVSVPFETSIAAVDQGDGWLKCRMNTGGSYFLPKEVSNKKIAFPTSLTMWRATSGPLAYRLSKQWHDTHPTLFVSAGSYIAGVLEDDAWLKSRVALE